MKCEECRYWIRDVFRPGADEGDCDIELPPFLVMGRRDSDTRHRVTQGHEGCSLGKPIEYRRVEL